MADWPVKNLLPDDPAEPMAPDRGGYTLTMRECRGTEAVLDMLAQTRDQAGGGPRLHLGWGSFRNLDIVAARHSDAALLLDVNVHQFRVWDAVQWALRHPGARNPGAWVDLVLPKLPVTPPLRQFSASTRDWLRGDLARPGSWLYAADGVGFEWVRERVRAGQVAVTCLDMRGGRSGAAGFQDLSRRLKLGADTHGVCADTLYVSNLPWMMGLPSGFFGESHQEHAQGVGRDGVLAHVRHHLGMLAPSFGWVISAASLCHDATDDNLQWETQALSPAAFMAEAHWAAIPNSVERVTGAKKP